MGMFTLRGSVWDYCAWFLFFIWNAGLLGCREGNPNVKPSFTCFCPRSFHSWLVLPKSWIWSTLQQLNEDIRFLCWGPWFYFRGTQCFPHLQSARLHSRTRYVSECLRLAPKASCFHIGRKLFLGNEMAHAFRKDGMLGWPSQSMPLQDIAPY